MAARTPTPRKGQELGCLGTAIVVMIALGAAFMLLILVMVLWAR